LLAFVNRELLAMREILQDNAVMTFPNNQTSRNKPKKKESMSPDSFF
jgi:hypothetical protein